MRRAPDRATRRLVADLAAMHADDLAAILSAFGPKERQQIEALLQEFGGTDAPAPPRASGIDESQLSQWLVEHMKQDAAQGAAMTASARDALRACALRLFPAGGAPAKYPAKSGLPSFGSSFFANGRRPA